MTDDDELTPEQKRQMVEDLLADFEAAGRLKVVGVNEKGLLVYRVTRKGRRWARRFGN